MVRMGRLKELFFTTFLDLNWALIISKKFGNMYFVSILFSVPFFSRHGKLFQSKMHGNIAYIKKKFVLSIDLCNATFQIGFHKRFEKHLNLN